MRETNTQSNFVPSLHLFSERKKRTSEFCDIEYLQQYYAGQSSEPKREQKIEDLNGLSEFIQNTKMQTNTKLILFNEPEHNSRCPELILETAWELTKKNLGRILVVDCDFRTNSLNENYRLEKSEGVVDYINGNLASIDQIIKKTNIENVFLVQGGRLPKEKINILLSEKFSELISCFKDGFDYILFNSPPYLSYIDTFLLSKVLRPVFVQVALNGCNPNQLSGIRSEIDVLNLSSITIHNLRQF